MPKSIARTARSHRKLVLMLSVFVIGMFGFVAALIPLYNTLCRALGINGKTSMLAAGAPSHVVQDRTVYVEFMTVKNGGIPWEFYPETTRIQVHPGEVARLSFYAENKTDHAMTVQAIPSVTPGLAAKHIKKIQCFCFTKQTLGPHTSMHMPLLFHVDADLPKDIQTITLSYTLFDISRRAN